jgi:exopolyphosphatase/guanosine-5'-triphosphate,3'-diphosphate pyrophosphatase
VEVLNPGRYAAIDVGSHSVLLLVAEVDAPGRLTAVAEGERVTRLAERFGASGRLARAPRERTLDAIGEFARVARRAGADGISVVGTGVLRAAENAAEFIQQVRLECGLSLEVLSGEREAELAYRGNLHDQRLPGVDGERIVIDIGGASTEIVRGIGARIHRCSSYPVGALSLTEALLRSDPPTPAECAAAEARIEEHLADVEPMAVASVVLASGGTAVNLGRVAQAAGMIPPGELHGAAIPHARIVEIIELFRTLPVKFRRRVPGVDPERADVILAGGMLLHQAMAHLSAPTVRVTTNGVRHGCVFALAQSALLPR